MNHFNPLNNWERNSAREHQREKIWDYLAKMAVCVVFVFLLCFLFSCSTMNRSAPVSPTEVRADTLIDRATGKYYIVYPKLN
jgi:hypothetical protein